FFNVLPATVMGRLGDVLAGGSAIFGEGVKPANASFKFHSLASVNWLWPAFNLNVVPPEPLRPEQQPYVIALAGLVVIYAVLGLMRRRVDHLFFGVVGIGLLLLVGVVVGVFESDYELFRALAILFFVPIAVVFVVPASLGLALANF